MAPKRYVLGIIVAALALGIAITVLISRPATVAHQRPYHWDSFALPRMTFNQQPVAQVAQVLNDAANKASHGALKQVIFLDMAPITVSKVTPGGEFAEEMDQLIVEFLRNDEDLTRRGASGSGNARYTGTQIESHSLGCFLAEVAVDTGLEYSERQDGIHLSRPQAHMECRAYSVSPRLVSRMEQMRNANVLHVNAEPIVSALIDVTGIHSWSVMVPDGPDSASGEFRFDKVFRYLPKRDVILAIATPEEHKQAMKRMTETWAEVTTQPSPMPPLGVNGAVDAAHK